MKHIKHSRFSPVNATETLEVTVRVLVKKKKKKSYLFIFALFGFVRVGCYREENSEAQEVK